MRFVETVNVRRLTAAVVVAAALFCGQARADVLEQVPSDAAALIKIKNLGELNTKAAKMAKAFGLDELKPELKDPLNAMLEEAHLTKGINKDSDAALVMFAPEKGGSEEPIPLAIIPVSDYDAFVSNFKKADGDGGGDITAVKDPEHEDKTLYVVHHGNYAVLSNEKGHLTAKAGGLKMPPASAKEVAAKDAVFYINMAVVREKALPEFKAHRKEWVDDMNKELAAQAELKAFAPVIQTVANQAMDVAQTFLEDANAVVFSVNLNDEGISGGGMVEFAPESKYGMIVGKMKSSGVPLLAGLPDQKYFLFGGSSVDPTPLTKSVDEFVNPIIKDLNGTNTDLGKKIADMLETGKGMGGSCTHSVAGLIMPTKPAGQESIVQEISVIYGDAKLFAAGEKKIMTDTSDLMGMLPEGANKTKVEFGAPKNVDGVDITTYTTKLVMDPNDPAAIQAQQVLTMLYGPVGMTGNFGTVDNKTFILGQGVDDDALKALIASAKSRKDVMSDSPLVKGVSSQLPKEPLAVYYVQFDNILSTGVRYAQGFGLPFKVKVPTDLAPIGVSMNADGSALRMDTFIPAKTVQRLIAVGLQAYMQGGVGGGL